MISPYHNMGLNKGPRKTNHDKSSDKSIWMTSWASSKNLYGGIRKNLAHP
jgi:hypothetical protein